MLKKQRCDPVVIGKKLVELRGLRTRIGVAREVGIPAGTLGDYEGGRRVPPDRIKILLSEYYRVPIQKLFFDES